MPLVSLLVRSDNKGLNNDLRSFAHGAVTTKSRKKRGHKNDLLFCASKAIKMTLFFCASDFHLNLKEFCFPLQKERSYCLQEIFWMLMVTNEAEILC